MKKKLIFLVIIFMICISIVFISNAIDNSIKNIPEKAILL